MSNDDRQAPRAAQYLPQEPVVIQLEPRWVTADGQIPAALAGAIEPDPAATNCRAKGPSSSMIRFGHAANGRPRLDRAA